MDANSIQIQALVTFLMPLVIQYAKRSHAAWLAWIDQNKPKVCLLTSAAAALATSMGIEIVHAPHSLTVTWPGGATVARGLVTFLVATVVQFAGQHALYDGFWRHVVPIEGARSQEPGVRSTAPALKS